MRQPSENKMIRLQEDKQLNAIHCPHCNRLLLRANLAPGSIVEVKCHNCGIFTFIRESVLR